MDGGFGGRKALFPGRGEDEEALFPGREAELFFPERGEEEAFE
jgi:hypothetical protein